MNDINYTPNTIRQIQQERIKQLETRIERLKLEVDRLIDERDEHYAMLLASEKVIEEYAGRTLARAAREAKPSHDRFEPDF